ncbi:MAG TPA: lysophospholipid acyltransferase family protein [Vicinamibacterales bacterium]|nr:lysophospholipid acyltransferase family protein [Vicinamibacterales bacterium]
MEPWSYEPVSVPEPARAWMRRFPRDPDMTVYAIRTASQLVVRALLRGYNRFDVQGSANLPLRESFVMVCNHSSHLDALCLTASLPLARVHRAYPAAAADYFFSSLPRSVFSILVVNGLPFDREHGSAGSLETCRQLLAQPGNVLIMFPEGTRSPSGALGRFRSGIGRLVAGTATPVVPCHLAGAHDAWPKGAVLPRPRTLLLRIGRPRVFLGTPPDDRAAAASIGARLREDVLELAQGQSVTPPT